VPSLASANCSAIRATPAASSAPGTSGRQERQPRTFGREVPPTGDSPRREPDCSPCCPRRRLRAMAARGATSTGWPGPAPPHTSRCEGT
jgi:hypothetical protein